ncbi:Polysialic acid transport protein KpsM [Caprobacter fermentans]|uniref:Transport permease protein n=1 Tax=Caproicibacter fermentans TaxID=2576756 RepID=A0A6N8HXE8_9FIRM|nr:ABC transporter permease [Caproicibacter fermentans]MVB10063.1 Polysialic acid transport protein KpsM [Caproicibacter fermentans]
MINSLYTYFRGLVKYRWLLRQLIARDNKVKYKRSLLGYAWSILNPLLMMSVMTAVFSGMFRFDIPNFPIYFICGNLIFSFFQESTTMSMGSIISNAGLLKKVYIPKYIMPLSKTMSSFVNLWYSLVALFLILIVTRTRFQWTLLLIPLPLLYLFFFSFGIGLLLCVLATFFRDALYLYNVFITALMYLTPIFYPISAVPDVIKKIIYWNPLYYFVLMLRQLVLDGTLPTLKLHLVCISFVVISLTVGLTVFYKNQTKFFLYI